MLRQMFDSWRHDRRCSQNFQPWLQQCDREEAQHLAHFRDLAPRVVTAVRQDDLDFYEGLAANAGRESLRGSRQLWSALSLTCVAKIESQATLQSQKCWTVSGRQDQPLQFA